MSGMSAALLARAPSLCRPLSGSAGFRSRRTRTSLAVRSAATQQKVWRPSLDDVRRISQGDAAKHRGTGSRAVPHRLNAEERQAYDLANQKGVLTITGTGHRRERKGSPLANIFRQLCDARGHPCVVLARGAGAGQAGDAVLVDLSTLRLEDVSQYREACRAIAARHGCTALQQPVSPFTVILPPQLIAAMLEGGGESSSTSSGGGDSGAAGSPAATAAARDAPAAADSSSRSSSDVAEQLVELRASAPIWQQPPVLECFAADRGTAKALAKQLAEELRDVGAAATA